MGGAQNFVFGCKNLRRLARIFGTTLSEIWRSVCRILAAVAKFKGAKNLTDLRGTPSHRFGTQNHTREINQKCVPEICKRLYFDGQIICFNSGGRIALDFGRRIRRGFEGQNLLQTWGAEFGPSHINSVTCSLGLGRKI